MAEGDFGRQHFEIEAGTDKLKKQLDGADKMFNRLADNVEKDGSRMDAAMLKIGKAAAGVFAFAQIQQFAAQVIRARSEIEKYEVSFRTLLGSAEKGQKLFGQIREFAVKTPLQLGTLAGAAQTMLGFNIDENKIMPMLKNIGDIAMGDAQKMQSLTLAFSQMSATGKLMGQDLLQMINAGFNPLAVISEKTGKSIGQLKKEMEAGAISADMVADAFKSAASEGGKFYGMMEAQSKTIAGAMSNLQGSIEDALNAFGTEAQPAIVGTINLLTELVKHYEAIGKAVMSLIEVYGIYKAASLVASMTQGVAAAGSLTASLRTLATTLRSTAAAQWALNAAAAANPYVLLATVVLGAAAAIYTFTDHTSEAEKAEKRLAQREEEVEKSINDRREASERLMQVVTDETKGETERTEALVELKRIEEDVFGEYDSYIDLTNRRAEAEKRLTDAINERANAQRESDYKADREALDTYKDYLKKHDRTNRENLTYQGQIEANKSARALLDAYIRYHGLTEEQGKHVQLSDAERWGASLQGIVNKSNNRRSASAQKSYLGSLQTMSLEELGKQEEKMKSLLGMAREQRKQYVSINDTLVSQTQLEERIAAIQNLQKAERKTPAQWKAAARKAVEDAERELAAFDAQNKVLSKAQYAQRAELKKKVDDAKKAYGQDYESYDSESKSGKKQKQQEAELTRKRADEARQYELEVREAAIAGMQEGFEREIAALKLGYDKEMLAIEQQKKAMADAARKVAEGKGSNVNYFNDDMYLTQAERDRLAGREAIARNKMVQGGIQAVSGAYATTGEKQQRQMLKYASDIQAIETLIGEVAKSELSDREAIVARLREEVGLVRALKTEEENRARLELGMQYGTMESREQATREYYSDKISTARANGDPYEAARLIAEQMEKLASLRSENANQRSANAIALSNADSRVLQAPEMRAFVQEAIATLKGVRDGGEFGSMNATDQQTILNALDRLTTGGILQSLEQLRTQATTTAQALASAKEQQSSAERELAVTTGRRDVLKAVAEVNPKDAQAQKDYAKAQEDVVVAQKKLKDSTEAVAVQEGRLEQTTRQAIEAQRRTFAGAFKGGLEDFTKRYRSDKGGSATKAAFDDFGQLASSGGAINESLDKMGISMSEEAGKAMEGLAQGASAASKAMSGDFVGAAVDAFSMFGSFVDFFAALSDNWEEMQDRIDLNTEALENLGWSLDKMRDELNDANSLNAASKVEAATANIAQQQASLQDSIDATARMYKGASHSMQYYLDDEEDYQDLRRRIRGVQGFETFDFDRMGQYTAEQWYNLRRNYIGLYTELQNAISSVEEDHEGKVGKGLNELLDQMTELNGLGDEFNEKMREIVTGMSFDSFKDDYKAMLKELGNASSSWREKMMQQTQDAVIARVADTQEAALQNVYNRMAEAIQRDDYNALRNLTSEAERLAQEAENRINGLINNGVIQRWGITFSEVYDGFEDMLGNMESTTMDFFDDLQEKINKIFTDQIADQYREEMEAAQKKLTEAIRSQNKTAIEAAMSEYMAIVERARADRSELEQSGLIKDLTESEGNATSRMASGITREDGAEINGRVTQIAIGQQREYNLHTQMQLTLQEQAENVREIAQNTRRLAAIEEHLSEIDRNTKRL